MVCVCMLIVSMQLCMSPTENVAGFLFQNKISILGAINAYMQSLLY